MCGGGGGDGGAEAARRSEAENLADIEQARRTLASLYGAGYDHENLQDGAYTGPELSYYGLDPSGEFAGMPDRYVAYPGFTRGPDKYVAYPGFTQGPDANPYVFAGGPTRDEYTRHDWGAEEDIFDQEAYDRAMEEFKAGYGGADVMNRLQEAPIQAEDLTYGGYKSDYGDLSFEYDPSQASEGFKNFMAREQRYGDMRKSILDELIENPVSGMDRLRTNAYRDIRSDMIRRGMVGGGADIQSRSQVNQRYGEGVSDINERADTAVRGARGDDYDRYLRAVRAMEGSSDVQSGMDILGGDKRLYTDQWLNEAKARDYSNWFADLMDMYNLSQYRGGQQEGIDTYRNRFSPGAVQPGASGRIY